MKDGGGGGGDKFKRMEPLLASMDNYGVSQKDCISSY